MEALIVVMNLASLRRARSDRVAAAIVRAEQAALQGELQLNRWREEDSLRWFARPLQSTLAGARVA
ncbi:MAG TPA: hypothetical protein VIV60_29615 [Polyangiaceae bacterium]